MRKLLPNSLAAFALLLTAAAFARAQDGPAYVGKVEPPSWWANHSINPVRLLVRGKNLRGAGVVADGMRVGPVRANDAGTYLFVDLFIPPDIKPGSYALLFTRGGRAFQKHFEILPPLDP